jgi:ABC-type nitrate/sulfonate/bicarbonate transport system permease component
MLHAKARTDTPRMFAALIVLAAIGIILYLASDRLLRRAVAWHAESNPAED